MQEFLSDLPINPTLLGLVPIVITSIFKLIEYVVTKKSEGSASSSRTLIHVFLSVSAAFGISIIVYSVLRPAILNHSWVALLVAIFTVPVLCALITLIYAILQTEIDVNFIDAVKTSFWEPFIRFRRWFLPFRLNHPKATIILIIFVGLLWVTPLFFALSPRPQPFHVYVRRPNDPSLDLGMIGNLDAAIQQIAGDMKPYDIEVEQDPEDGSPADLLITITPATNDCAAASTPYRWAMLADGALSPLLNIFLEETGGLGKEYPNGPCNWIRTQDDIVALILFANGLDKYYIQGQPAAAAERFREVNKIMAPTTRGDYQAENDEKVTEELLRIPRRIRNCAQVMNVIADGSFAGADGQEALTNVITIDPYGINSPPLAEFCIAHAYYWLGRGALERHFNALKEVDSESPDPAKLLEAAHDYFTLAIQTYKTAEGMSPNGEAKGYGWIYYFYRGLTSYRQGNLVQADADLALAEANSDLAINDHSAKAKASSDSAINDHSAKVKANAYSAINDYSAEMISYMRTRIGVEQAQYHHAASLDAKESICENAVGEATAQVDPSDLQLLTGVRSRSRQDLSIGTMARFNLALYWAAQEPKDTQNQCAGVNSESATVGARCTAILEAAHALQMVAGDTDNNSVRPDSSPIDVFLATLYKLDGQHNAADSMLRNGTLDNFRSGAGVPAYVIPLSPRLEPDMACGQATDDYRTDVHRLDGDPLVFRWLLRNSYDELLFDYQPSTSKDNPGSPDCESTFCVALDDGVGLPRYWRLNDLGFGLFETGPITPIDVVLTARPELNGGIRMDGEQRVSLVYKDKDEELRELYVGSLPITTAAHLSAEVEVNWVGKDEEGEECSWCYEIDVTALLTGDGVDNISRLSINGTDDLPDLIFKAALYEEVGVAEGQWRPVTGVLDFQLEASDDAGHFMGHLSSVELDPDKPHAIRVFVEDGYGNRKARYWSEDIEIVPPL